MTRPIPELPSWEELYSEAACGLLLTNSDGTILRVNETFCRWVGYSAEELVEQRTMQSLLSMGGRIFHQTHWQPLLMLQGSVAEVSLDMVHCDGHRIPMMMNAQRRVRADAVLHELAVFMAEDRHTYERELLLARKRSEELLRSEQLVQEALRAMMGIVSHDLRNPLSVVAMSCTVLARRPHSDDQRVLIDRIARAATQSTRLIADLLDFTAVRIGGGLSIDLAPIDLHSVVAVAVDDLRAAFPARLLRHTAQGDGSCMADAGRIRQLLGNLVANAVAYGAPDGPVDVYSQIDEERFLIAVHNDGNPIPEGSLHALFEPMLRGPEARGAGGVGLGLFIVQEIARLHSGHIAVASSAAEGTTFTASFPQTSRPASEPSS